MAKTNVMSRTNGRTDGALPIPTDRPGNTISFLPFPEPEPNQRQSQPVSNRPHLGTISGADGHDPSKGEGVGKRGGIFLHLLVTTCSMGSFSFCASRLFSLFAWSLPFSAASPFLEVAALPILAAVKLGTGWSGKWKKRKNREGSQMH